MLRKNESGKLNPLISVVITGVIIITGVWLILSWGNESKDLVDPDTVNIESQTPEVVGEINDTEVAAKPEPVEEEKAKLIRTVDGNGKRTWIKAEPINIYDPGGKTRKGFFSASETGKKMKPAPPPMRVKLNENLTVESRLKHPSETKGRKGPLKLKGEEEKSQEDEGKAEEKKD